MSKLSELKIKNFKPDTKKYDKADGGGLVLEIHPNGSKRWRYRYRFEGLAQKLSLGTYPDVPLKQAREKHVIARQQLKKEVNPSTWRKINKVKHGGENTLEKITREWHMSRKARWGEARGKNIITAFEKNVFPWLGNKEISSITAQQFLPCLKRMEERGALHSAHRLLADASRVFRYAVATGRTERDITYDLKGALPPHKKRHYATIVEPEKIGELLRAMEGFEGSFVVKSALKFLPLVFVRPGELRKAEWKEINIKNKEWVIPAEKMKMKEKHIVPLSPQAIAILEELRP